MMAFHDSENQEQDALDRVSDKLVNVPVGHHYLVQYSNLDKLRKVYPLYVKGQIKSNPDSVVVVLPYYETTDKVREALESKGIDVKGYEKQGTLIIVDIEDVLANPYFKGPNIEVLREFTKEIVSKAQDKTVFVIADMSVFNHLKKVSGLLDYERTLHKDLKVEKWKELCFYNERDFDTMFSKVQRDELLEYHKDRVITI
jgi:MEDS: MEthanogen/methylotroph, DcmR Sensory domain